MIKRLLLLFAALTLAVPLIAAPSSGPCGGKPGIQVWEGGSQSGGTWQFCSSGTSNVLTLSNLSNYGGGLGFGATWNDRISSLRTIDTPSNKCFSLYSNTSYGGWEVKVCGTMTLNSLTGFWPNVWQFGFDDQASSIRTTNP